jgi:hypothetical protein
MGARSKLTLPRIFGMGTSSVSLLINRNLYILWPARSCRLLATFGAPKILPFSKVGRHVLLFPMFLMSFQTSVGGSEGKASSGAHTVDSVSCSRRRPLFQELPRVVVDCSPLSQRDTQGWVGNVRLVVSRYTVLLISAHAFVLGKWHPIVW